MTDRSARHAILSVGGVLLAFGLRVGPALADSGGSASTPPTFTLFTPTYTLLNPTPDSALRSFSTDRPTKSNVPFTVDAGRFQIETDIANFSYDNTAGVKTRTFQALDPAFKLGVTSSIDVEVQFNGLQSISVGNNTVPTTHNQGFGDVFFRSKINLIGNDSGDLAVTVLPYVKAPSQRAVISNGVVEGGIIIPISYKLPNDFVLLVDPEFDALKNISNSSRHVNFTNLVNISHPVPGIKDLTVLAEFFAMVPDERGAPNIYTADFALAYDVTPIMQLDVGTNIGLNAAAPDLQVYTGISAKF